MSKNGFKDYGMKIVIAVGLAASIGLRSYGIFFQAPDSSEDNGPPKPAYINLKESKTQKEFRKRRQKIVSVGQNKKNTLTKKFQQQSTFLLEKSRKNIVKIVHMLILFSTSMKRQKKKLKCCMLTFKKNAMKSAIK